MYSPISKLQQIRFEQIEIGQHPTLKTLLQDSGFFHITDKANQITILQKNLKQYC